MGTIEAIRIRSTAVGFIREWTPPDDRNLHLCPHLVLNVLHSSRVIVLQIPPHFWCADKDIRKVVRIDAEFGVLIIGDVPCRLVFKENL